MRINNPESTGKTKRNDCYHSKTVIIVGFILHGIKVYSYKYLSKYLQYTLFLVIPLTVRHEILARPDDGQKEFSGFVMSKYNESLEEWFDMVKLPVLFQRKY